MEIHEKLENGINHLIKMNPHQPNQSLLCYLTFSMQSSRDEESSTIIRTWENNELYNPLTEPQQTEDLYDQQSKLIDLIINYIAEELNNLTGPINIIRDKGNRHLLAILPCNDIITFQVTDDSMILIIQYSGQY